MNIKNIVAVDYKGKHFVLMDKDRVDDTWDIVDDNIDIKTVIEKNLKAHVMDCIYYGIPAYVGNDKELNARIKELKEEYNKKGNDLKRN